MPNLFQHTFLITDFLIMIFSSCGGNENLKGQIVEVSSKENKSIYELEDSITAYETNFENLFQNWTTKNTENVNNYKLTDYSIVETTSDSSIFGDYRNYFKSNEPSGSQIKIRRAGGHKGLFHIYPSHRYSFLYADDLPKNFSKWMDREFQKEALNLLNKNLNLETTKLLRYRINEDKLEYSTCTYAFLRVRSKETISRSINKFSIDS